MKRRFVSNGSGRRSRRRRCSPSARRAADAQEIAAHRSAQGRAGGAQAAPVPPGALRDRADRSRSRCSTSTGAPSSSARALNYNITDWFAIGVWGGVRRRSARRPTSPTRSTASRRATPSRRATSNHSAQPVGPPGTAAVVHRPDRRRSRTSSSPQVTFIPFRGKLAIFNKLFVDTDLYAPRAASCRRHPGARGLRRGTGRPRATTPALVRRWLEPDEDRARRSASASRSTRADFVVVGVEYRALPFSWNRAGFDSRGSGTNGNFPDGKVNGDGRHVQVQPDGHDSRRLLAPDEAAASASSASSGLVRRVSASGDAPRVERVAPGERLAHRVAALVGHGPAARDEALGDLRSARARSPRRTSSRARAAPRPASSCASSVDDGVEARRLVHVLEEPLDLRRGCAGRLCSSSATRSCTFGSTNFAYSVSHFESHAEELVDVLVSSSSELLQDLHRPREALGLGGERAHAARSRPRRAPQDARERRRPSLPGR